MDRVAGVSERFRSPRWRRGAALGLLCLGLAAAVAAFSPGGGAHAQAAEARWWEGIPGFGSPSPDSQRARPRSEPQGDPLNDLRADAVPWRSDVMVEALDRAIERYQRIVSAGGWPQVPGPRMIRPGDDDERVPALRRRLRMSGDLARGGGYESYTYDGELESAVRRFQARHGLRVSGRVDQPTFAALNVSAESRWAQLKLNRGRIVELLGQRIEDRYVLVNVPAFQLEAVERHEVALRHRVIVGRTERQTPTLKATIRGLNFFPYWRVPESVATLDVIPRLRKEPQYLVNEKIRVFNGHNGPELDPMQVDWNTADGSKLKFKQDPGQQNALGLVRIDMANEHGVYMHDTPLKKLFEQRGRAFSAGCVRVQGVFELVEWIARGEPGWDQPGRVDEVIASGQALDLNLTRPIPVYFAYITAWAEPSGRIEFRPDLYGRDGARDLAGDRDPDAPPPPSGGLAP